MSTPNLFAKPTGAAANTSAKKDEKVVVTLESLAPDLTRLAQINKQITELEAEQKILSGVVKEEATSAFINLFKNTKRYPGSFLIKAGQASMMFVPTDKYISITPERATELREKIGNDIVTENTTYTMNADLIEKYGEVLSNLIWGCKDISDDDKENLIQVATKYTIAKGAIETANAIEGHDISEVITEIKPIFQMKNIAVKA